MNHNYVSISFPQQKMKLSDWEISQIKKAVDNQTAEIKKLITKAITAIGQSTSPPPDNAIAPLQNLQAAYLPEGWFAPCLHYELEELFRDMQNSSEPVEAQDFLDELKGIFCCIDLGGSSAEAIAQELNAELDKLAELSDNGLCHAIAGHWVIGSVEPEDHDDRSNHELWQQIHRMAALPAEVRQLLNIGLPDNRSMQVGPPISFYLSLH